VPRKIAGENGLPRRRRGADTVAVEADAARGLAMRILLYSPKDMVAGALAFAAVSAIVANALFLQAGRHPSPMFGPAVVTPAAALAPISLLPRPRPVEADLPVSEPRSAEARSAEPKPADPMTNLVRATSTPAVAPATIARPPAPIPAPSRTDTIPNSGSRRAAAVQRALTEYGYGQLKPTGTVGSDTQAAISKFEREHKLPVTGQMSDRLVHELTVMIGHAID
jgi:Putative peptidoglycan binding domain